MIFLIGKFRKQLKCSIMGNRLNKLWYRHIKYFAKNDEDIDIERWPKSIVQWEKWVRK